MNPTKLENCKQLVRELITRAEPPEFALENYDKKTYDIAIKEVLTDGIQH